MGELIKIEDNKLSELISENKLIIDRPFKEDILLTNGVTEDGYRAKNIKSIFEDVNIGDKVKLILEPKERYPNRIIVRDMNYCWLGELKNPTLELIANLMRGGKKLYGAVKEKIMPEVSPPADMSEEKIELYSFQYADYKFSIDIYMED